MPPALAKSVDELIHLLHSESAHTRSEALSRAGKLVAEERSALRTRLLELLNGEYAPSPNDSPWGRQKMIRRWVTRGWLVSALARVCDGDEEAIRLLEARSANVAAEPIDWVRFWCLAGLHRAEPARAYTTAKKVLELAKLGLGKEKRLVHDLALAIAVREHPSESASELAEIRSILQCESDRISAVIARRKQRDKNRGLPTSSGEQDDFAGAEQDEDAGMERNGGAGEGAIPGEKHDDAWEMLRALREVPLDEDRVVELICRIVEGGELGESTQEAIVALGEVPREDGVAENAVMALQKYLNLNPWPSHDLQRASALESLGKLRSASSSALIVRHMFDENPWVAQSAARALERALGCDRVVTVLMEEAVGRVTGGADRPRLEECFRKLGQGLKWMQGQKKVTECLDKVLRSKNEHEQKCALELLQHMGGALAYEKLLNTERATSEYFDVVKEMETNLQTSLQKSLADARKGLWIAHAMSIVVFLMGAVLLGLAVLKGWTSNDPDDWKLVLTLATPGMAGVISTLILGPRRQVREGTDHFMRLNFLNQAYLRQLRQVDLAYTRQIIESSAMSAQQVQGFARLVHQVVSEVFQLLPTARQSRALRRKEGGPVVEQALATFEEKAGLFAGDERRSRSEPPQSLH
ncbi:MAG TPA: hypothetical protein VK447_12415 [Myxococcaceae bacterium]|nr:hypothetical protein [Myxococcaceae bacterium]